MPCLAIVHFRIRYKFVAYKIICFLSLLGSCQWREREKKKWIQISKLNCINISWAHKLYSIAVCPEFMMFYLMFRSHFVASLFLFSPSLIPYKNNSCNCQASAALFIKVNIYYIFVWFFFGYFVVGSLLFSLMGIVWRFVCIVIDTLSLVRSALQYHCRPMWRIRNAHDTARMAHCALSIAYIAQRKFNVKLIKMFRMFFSAHSLDKKSVQRTK